MKLLFIGDLRNCYNYGAIATTESLIKMIGEKYPNAEIKYIDFRSLQNATPPGGWNIERGDVTTTKLQILIAKLKKKFIMKKIRIRQCVKNIVPYGIILKRTESRENKNKTYGPNMHYHIPFLIKDYEKWGKNMMDGKVLQFERGLLEWADKVVVNG